MIHAVSSIAGVSGAAQSCATQQVCKSTHGAAAASTARPRVGSQAFVAARRPAILKQLLKAGPLVNAQGCEGRTALHEAVVISWPLGTGTTAPALFCLAWQQHLLERAVAGLTPVRCGATGAWPQSVCG